MFMPFHLPDPTLSRFERLTYMPLTVPCHVCAREVVCDSQTDIPHTLCHACGEAACCDCLSDGMCPECFMVQHPHHFVIYRKGSHCIVQRRNPPVCESFPNMRDAIEFARRQPPVAMAHAQEKTSSESSPVQDPVQQAALSGSATVMPRRADLGGHGKSGGKAPVEPARRGAAFIRCESTKYADEPCRCGHKRTQHNMTNDHKFGPCIQCNCQRFAEGGAA